MPRPVSVCVLCGTPIEGKVVVDIYIRNRRAYSQRKLASLCARHWAVIESVLKAEGLVGAAKMARRSRRWESEGLVEQESAEAPVGGERLDSGMRHRRCTTERG